MNCVLHLSTTLALTVGMLAGCSTSRGSDPGGAREGPGDYAVPLSPSGIVYNCRGDEDRGPCKMMLATTATPSSSLPGLAPPSAGALPLSPRGTEHLAADLARRLGDALQGSDPAPAHVTVDDTFVVIAADPAAPLDAAVSATQQTVDALWHSVFQHRPETAVVAWIASSPATLGPLVHRRLPDVPGANLGIYDPKTRQLFAAADPSGSGSWNHEVVHPLVQADFPLAPSWLLEGLPSLFEVSQLRDDGTFAFGAHFRLETVRRALKSEAAREVRLDTLLTWSTDRDFHLHEALHYAVAREALRWLHSQGLLWTFYRAYRDGVLDDPTGEQAFKTTVHMTPYEANEAWHAWLLSPEAEGMVPR